MDRAARGWLGSCTPSPAPPHPWPSPPMRSETDLHGARLNYADLHGADLHGANLVDADLRGAGLGNASLHGAILNGMRWSERTQWPKPEMAETMRARSEPLGGGLWRVLGSGNTGADIEISPLAKQGQRMKS